LQNELHYALLIIACMMKYLDTFNLSFCRFYIMLHEYKLQLLTSLTWLCMMHCSLGWRPLTAINIVMTGYRLMRGSGTITALIYLQTIDTLAWLQFNNFKLWTSVLSVKYLSFKCTKWTGDFLDSLSIPRHVISCQWYLPLFVDSSWGTSENNV